jgi:hypothetical protein
MNVNQIEIALSQKIGVSTTNFELLAASKALQLLRTNGVFVVSTYGSLPAAASNEGKIYFIEDIETVVWSNGAFWLRLLDKEPAVTQIWGWGASGSGQLGDGTTLNRCSPIRERCSATDWRSVSAGGSHTAAIKTSGQLWAWGENSAGRLGDGTETSRCSPVRERCSATDWCQVSGATSHTAAVKTSGQIWVWGFNSCGRLGDGTVATRCSPVREISSSTDWCQVSAGGAQTAALNTSGQLWMWGVGSCGRLGTGTVADSCSPVRERCSATDWCRVFTGALHTAAIKTSGQLWTWGYNNSSGRLGDGATVDRCSPVREFCSATDWCQVGVGYFHTAAIKTSGQLWTWGSNTCGRLGDGTTVDRCSPVREFCSATDWGQINSGIGGVHTAAVKTSGQLWAWGINTCGRLGDGTTVLRCSPVREFCSATDWYRVSLGAIQTVAIKVS